MGTPAMSIETCGRARAMTDTPTKTSPKLNLTARDRRVLDSLFAIDTRALAALRIGLAAIILYEAFFIVLPRPRTGSGLGGFTVDYAGVLIIPFAVMLLIGYRTRFATILCWLLYSIPIRSALLTPESGVDLGNFLLALFLFWGMFLPLGANLSSDAGRDPASKPVRVLSVGSAAVLVQVFIIYFSSGVTKDMGEWVFDPTALETVLGIPRFSTDLGQALTQFPAVLGFFSVTTVVFEIIGTVLLFVPGRTLNSRRTVIATAFIGFHAGIALLMGIGIFPFVMMFVWLVFLPTPVWDRLFNRNTPEATPVEAVVDRNRSRNITAALALGFIIVSNAFTWLYYPVQEGFPAAWQTVGRYLLLYQQWAMFSVPSSLT